MTVLTGETGAGKTLVVEALQLVLGGRADPGMVRAGAAEALVEARFVVGEGAGEARGRRSPAPCRPRAGRGPGSTAAWPRWRALGEAAAELVEVHGQHEHRALVTPAAQRGVLDAFAGTDLGRVRALREPAAHRSTTRWRALGGDAQQRAREADVLRYQLTEIDAAGLDDPDEEAALRAEEERLADAAAYREAAPARWPPRAGRTAGPDEGGALDLLGRAGRARWPGGSVRRSIEPGWRPPRSSSPTWPARCVTKSRHGTTTRGVWPRSRSADGCWPTCGASTARTSPP